MPIKDTSLVAITEKSVKAILNKMTKEKFDKLADQMCEIPITNYEILCKMIYNVYEKAIFEPTFGDIYAELCLRLSQKAQQNPFVHIIESDEEPPTEDGEMGQGGGESSNYTVFRWSNDVTTDDNEIVGPFSTVEECIDAAIDADICPEPMNRDGMELKLHSLKIKCGTFIKVMTSKDYPEKFFTVFFPMSKINEVGQQVSEIFLSHRECEKNSNRENSFRNVLLNKCEEEFNKQDIYEDWKKEKKAYEEEKDKLSERDRLEKEEEFEFRRIKIKKQMLGNIHFIGELFKKEMLKPKIMMYCVDSLLKLEHLPTGAVRPRDEEMDEEDHEAVCKLFSTIGKTIDQGKFRATIDVYFQRIEQLGDDKNNLSSRARFMYKDLIELRHNRWVARREVETAKTLEEIKRDFEREELLAAQQSQQLQGRGNRNVGRQGGRGGRADYQIGSSNRSRPQRQEPSIDSDGFEQVSSRRGGYMPRDIQYQQTNVKILARNDSSQNVSKAPPQPTQTSKSTSQPLSKEKLEARVKSIKNEFAESNDVNELLLSMEEIRSTPDSGRTLVQINLDSALDCKDSEREAIFTMFKKLYEKGKLSPDDIKGPLGEIIEFIGSFVVDSPKAIQYVADLVADFIVLKAFNLVWFCDQAKKLQEFDGHYIPGLVELSILSLMARLSVDEVVTLLNKYNAAFVDLLGADAWKEIKSKY